MSRAVALLLALGALVLPSIARAHGRVDVRVPGRVDVRVPGRVDVRVPGRVDVRVPGRASGAVVAEREGRVGAPEFLQRDPEGYADSVNVYAAMGNDPINRRDPTGRLPDDPQNPPDPAFVDHLKALEASSGAPIYTGILRSPNLRVRQLQDGIRGGMFSGSWQRTSLLGIAGEAVYARHISRPIAGETAAISRSRRAVSIQPLEALAQELSPSGVPTAVSDAIAAAISEAGAPDVLGFMLGGKWTANYLNIYRSRGTTQLGITSPSYGPGGLGIQSQRVLSTGGSLLLAAEVKTVGRNSVDRALAKATIQVTSTARALASIRARAFTVGSSEGLAMLSVETRLDPWAALVVDSDAFAAASPSARTAAIEGITKAGGLVILYPGLLQEAGQLVSDVERGAR